MGGRSPEKELVDARTAYTAAVSNLHRALIYFYSSGVPLENPTGGRMDFQPWTKRQIRATVALKDAWTAVVETRRQYEATARLILDVKQDVH